MGRSLHNGQEEPGSCKPSEVCGARGGAKGLEAKPVGRDPRGGDGRWRRAGGENGTKTGGRHVPRSMGLAEKVEEARTRRRQRAHRWRWRPRDLRLRWQWVGWRRKGDDSMRLDLGVG
ncbi:hypothetical protein E2562_032814 [Oryza meyeriana var. granulata]|uniref:DUF834 domain-containing protein n=1 Tax=Oryza meyeriana var. granulata TaxID=110450 RepID=A0A6G1DQK4_9ORYZ|nr:hypothetical protein E2562_032814 [Oryza meyeriana var. granulata]